MWYKAIVPVVPISAVLENFRKNHKKLNRFCEVEKNKTEKAPNPCRDAAHMAFYFFVYNFFRSKMAQESRMNIRIMPTVTRIDGRKSMHSACPCRSFMFLDAR